MASRETGRTGSGRRRRSRLGVAAALRSRGLLRAACGRFRVTEPDARDGRIGEEMAARADCWRQLGFERLDRRKREAGRCGGLHSSHVEVTGCSEPETVSEDLAELVQREQLEK